MTVVSKDRIATRNLRPGETLLKPGDKIKSVFMIQSGRISLCQSKGGKVIEIAQLTAGQSIGDEAAFGPMPWTLTALALRDTVVFEVPLDAVTSPLNAAPPQLKGLLKALGERLKTSFGEVKTLKLNREVAPCPADNVAKAFGVIYHVARILSGAVDQPAPKGQAPGTPVQILEAEADWTEFRKFAWEVFEEPAVRLEDAVNILVKLGYARFEGNRVRLMDLKQVEAFFDYYGSYHFKGGYDDLLKTNSKMQRVTEEFLKIADKHPVDRGGNAQLPYKSTIDTMKKVMGGAFEADQLFRLEQKGLFIKRTATQDGGTLSFYRPDFDQMMLNWKLLRELELWNEKGFVEAVVGQPAPPSLAVVPADFDPVEERRKWAKALEGWQPVAVEDGAPPELRSGERKAGEVWCHVCMSVLENQPKACPTCGADVAKAS